MNRITPLCVIVLLSITNPAFAQFNVSAQLRIRPEFRNGQGAPSVKDTAAAFFTSQRMRLNLGFKTHRLHVFTAIQDVRVWGQDASTLNRTTSEVNDGLLIHEAWTEINLLDTGRLKPNFTLKAGRQELVYDDVRLLGNLDWLQQARRHDAILLKLEHKGWIAHAGAAFNQNAERKSNTIYNGVPAGYAAGTNGIGTLYKSMQFLYLGRKQKSGSASFLVFKDDFSKFRYAQPDSLKQNPIYGRSSWSRVTSGFYVTGAFNKISFTGSAYYQGGRYREGSTLNEYLLSLATQYAVTPKLGMGPGIDVTSGNNGGEAPGKFQRFDPLYGTPHKFWGYMDYFYVADGFGSNGLVDLYLKARHKPQDNVTLSLDVHRFSLPEAVIGGSGEAMKKLLGTEVDLTFSYVVTNEIVAEGGASYMFGTSTMSSPHVKNIANANTNASWAYVMLTVKPELMKRNK